MLAAFFLGMHSQNIGSISPKKVWDAIQLVDDLPGPSRPGEDTPRGV